MLTKQNTPNKTPSVALPFQAPFKSPQENIPINHQKKSRKADSFQKKSTSKKDEIIGQTEETLQIQTQDSNQTVEIVPHQSNPDYHITFQIPKNQ